NPAQSLNENTALDRQTFDQQLLQDYLLAEVCLYAVRKIKFILNQTSYNRENLNKWIYTAFAFLGYLDLVGVRFGNFQLREGFQVLGNILLTVSYLNNNHLFEELDTRKKTARLISSFEKLFCSVSFDSLEDLVRFAKFASNGSIEFRQGLLRELEDVLLAEESSIEFRQKIPVEVSEDLTQELKNNLEATLSRYLRGEISSFQAAVEILRANEPFFESSVKGSHVLGDAFARGEVSQIDGSLEILFSFKGIDTDPDSSVVLRLQEMPLTKDEVRKKIQELGYEFLPAYVDQQIQAQEGSTMLAKDGQTNVRKMCSPASLVRRLIAEKHLRPDEIAELLSELGNFFIELSRIASIEDEDIESHEVLAEVASILRLSRVLVAGVRAKQRRINWQISELSQVQGKNDNFGRLKHSTAQTLLSLPSNFDVRDLTFSVLQDLELLAEASCLEDLSGLEESTKLLLSLGFTIEQAKEVLKGNKELIYPSESKEYGLLWFFNNQLRPYLRENGFVTTLAVREALLKFPRILRPEVIFETEGVKQVLRDVGFRDPEIKVLFSKYPWFLTQSAGSIEKKIQSLTDTFQRFGLETSIEEIKSILSNRPHVLLSLGEDTQRVTTVKELVETAYSLGFIEEINQGVLISAYSHHVLILKAALQICVALQATKGLSLNIIRVADKIREKIFETYPEKVVSNNGRRLIRNFIGHLLVENPSLQEKQIVEIFVEKGFEAL
ncbi:MAG: hypothetical protein NZT61_02675, partial [Deltaproteobacteria bacterium]|nr:hypothetical protein [Deltaproteobacteria bacterium]